MYKIKKLQKCICECSGLSVDSINWDESLNLIDDLNFDSLTIISLVICIEEAFNIKISNKEFNLANLCSYAKLKKIIESN